jgi:hypothetical protein
VLLLLQSTGSCSMSVLKRRSPSLDSLYASGRPHTSGSWEVVCNWPRCGQTSGSCSATMEMCQRLESLKMSWDFAVLGKVTRNTGSCLRRLTNGWHPFDSNNIETEVRRPIVHVLGRWRVPVIPGRRYNRKGCWSRSPPCP